MSTHSRILAWRIPGSEKPGGLQSMGSQRVRLPQCIKQEDSGAYSQILALLFVSCVSQKDSSSLCYSGSSPHKRLHYYT